MADMDRWCRSSPGAKTPEPAPHRRGQCRDQIYHAGTASQVNKTPRHLSPFVPLSLTCQCSGWCSQHPTLLTCPPLFQRIILVSAPAATSRTCPQRSAPPACRSCPRRLAHTDPTCSALSDCGSARSLAERSLPPIPSHLGRRPHRPRQRRRFDPSPSPSPSPCLRSTQNPLVWSMELVHPDFPIPNLSHLIRSLRRVEARRPTRAMRPKSFANPC